MNQARQEELASDLAYVRSLAEEGAHAPLVGGRYYLIWGCLMAAASLVVYANAIGLMNWGPTGYLAPWAVFGALGWLLSFTISRGAHGKPGAGTLGNKTASSVWFSVGVVMTLFFIAFFFVHDRFTDRGVPAFFVFHMLYPIGFGVYGVAFYATATAARLSWLKGFAAVSWAFCVISLFFMTTAEQFLVGAAGMLVCAAAPGVILMRREPAEIV